MQRRNFIKNAGLAGGMMLMSPMLADLKSTEEYNFPLVDMHVHLISFNYFQFTLCYLVIPFVSLCGKINFL